MKLLKTILFLGDFSVMGKKYFVKSFSHFSHFRQGFVALSAITPIIVILVAKNSILVSVLLSFCQKPLF